MKWLKSLFSKDRAYKIPERFKYLESKDATSPINFGIKTFWCAVKSNSSVEVAEILGIDVNQECNWIEGTARAYDGQVFILPAIGDWVLIHGLGLPTPNTPKDMFGSDKFLNMLSIKLGEAQLFGNHRVSSSAFWMKSISGEVTRAYIIADATGGQIGIPTRIEQKWELLDLKSPEIENDDYWDRCVYPGEDEVLEVAEAWSVNPMKLESLEGLGLTGIFGTLKK